MRNLLIYILLFLGSSKDSIITSAQQAYEQGNYQKSIGLYFEAIDKYPEKSTQINYNLAQCYMQLEKLDTANYFFQLVLSTSDARLASKAANNIGVLQADKMQLNHALTSFREALIRDPENEEARYNFELVKREKAPPPKENDQPNQPPEDEADDPNTPPPPRSRMDDKELERLLQQIRKKMNRQRRSNDRALPFSDTLSQQEAKAVLEALRNQNPQFVQQLRKVVRSPRVKKNKRPRPDW